jgi:hypothetical protein
MRKISLVVVAVLSLAMALTVQSASKPTGALKVPANLLLELKIDNKPLSIPSGKEITFPAGVYTPGTLTAQAAAPGKVKPEIWSIKSTGPFGSISSIEVKEGCTSAIDAGPPFTLKPIVYKSTSAPTGKLLPIGLQILGKAGESYAANTLRRGQSSVPPPQFRIVDEAGKVLAQGNFEFG